MLSTPTQSVEVLCASKTRNTLTEAITSTHIHGDVEGKNLLILDDICDGGRTFTELAKELKHFGAQDVYLYVTHGIFSQGLNVFREHFKHVYCCHTWLSAQKSEDPILTILSTGANNAN